MPRITVQVEMLRRLARQIPAEVDISTTTAVGLAAEMQDDGACQLVEGAGAILLCFEYMDRVPRAFGLAGWLDRFS